MKKAESLKSQVNRLANFICENCPGYPNQNHGAIDCAIQIIKDLQGEIIYDKSVDIDEWMTKNKID